MNSTDTSPKNQINRQTIRIFWQEGWHDKRLLAVALLFPLGSILLSVVVPLIIGKVIAGLSLGDHAVHNALHYVPYMVGAAATGIVGNRVGFPALLGYQARTMSRLQEKALQALLSRSMGFHNNNIGGKLVSDTIDYPRAFMQLSNALFFNLAPLVLVLLFGSLLVFSESWQLGLLIALMAAYAVGSGVLDSRRRAPLRRRQLAANKNVTGHVADTVLNVQTVKTFAHESDELGRHHALGQHLLDLRLEDWRLAGRLGNNRIIVLSIMQVLFIVLLAYLIGRDHALLAIGIFAFSFTITISNRLFEINTMMRILEDGLLDASPMTEILLETPEILDRPNAQPLNVGTGEIALADVTFRYHDSAHESHLFNELSLRIAPGEKIGLVGPSGGGKSTLTRLLLRFEDVEAGSISIDGQNIAEVTQASLRQAIAYVPQEPLLFHRSIHDNIAYGKPKVTVAEVERAARLAHAHEFIKDLPDTYQTIVGERGVKLSGGQRQRIAIARAILKNAPILLLDEATSALDSESEVYIQEALWKLMEDRTAIVIAHRLSTIQKMDRIIVLEDGAITEEGTHAHLLKQHGTYAKLWAHQSGGFIEA